MQALDEERRSNHVVHLQLQKATVDLIRFSVVEWHVEVFLFQSHFASDDWYLEWMLNHRIHSLVDYGHLLEMNPVEKKKQWKEME